MPVSPKEKKRVLLYFLQSAPVSLLDGSDKAKKALIEELEAAGFQVTAEPDYYELEMAGQNKANRGRMMAKHTMEKVHADYDLCLVAINMKGYAQSNNTRVVYSVGHSYEIPWYVHELPTICVSLNYTNHLIDVPMMKTFVNAYSSEREYLHALVQKLTGRPNKRLSLLILFLTRSLSNHKHQRLFEKLTGKSPFKGKANNLVWCGRWDTRL